MSCKFRGTWRHLQHRKSGKLLLYHVQNILSGRSHRIRFTSVARHDQRSLIARAHMVGRTTTNSPTRIGMWKVVLHQNNGIKNNGPKQPTSLVLTQDEVVKTNKSQTFDAIYFDSSTNIAQRCFRSGHMEEPPQDVKNSMSVARVLIASLTFISVHRNLIG